MNIYSKLNDMRIDFLSSPHRKSGKNAYAGYSYFELGDFIPDVMQLCRKHGLFGMFSVVDGMALLKIHNVEKIDQAITFSAPFGSCNLKGCHEAQNVGASITYMRRYLWGMALEMVENDAIDSVTNPDEEEEKKAEKPYKNAPAIDVEKAKKAMQKAGNIETLDKYMASVNERGTPEQIEEVSRFYEEYRKAIVDVTEKVGKP